MGIDAYMVFNPTQSKKQTNSPILIAGESLDFESTGKGSFEIISFEWGASSVQKEKKRKTGSESPPPGTVVKGGTAPAPDNTQHRMVNVSSFKISKPFDKASLGLFMACTDVECVFKEAAVMFRKSGGGKPFVYLKFVFGEVRIDSIDWKLESVDGTDKPDQEDVNCSFETCDIFYSPQSTTGEKETRWGDSGQKKSASYKRSTESDEDE